MRRGFSLVEVLIALAVMSITVIGLGSVLTSGLKAQDKIDKGVTARAVADQIMGRTLITLSDSTDSKSVHFWETADFDESAPWQSGEQQVGTTLYYYTITGTEVRKDGATPLGSSSTSNRLKRLTIQVAWSDKPESERAGIGRQAIVISRLLNRGSS